MGGKSTSQGAVLSGKKANGSSGFDLHSWQGLTEVLKRGKESLNDPAKYAEFRNLVLEYAQGGGDIDLKKQIDIVVATFTASSEKTSDDAVERQSRKRKRSRSKKKTHVEIPVQQSQTPHGVKKPGSAVVKERRNKPAFKDPVLPEPIVQKNDIEPPVQLPVDGDLKPPVQKQQIFTPEVTPEPVVPPAQVPELKQKQTPEPTKVVEEMQSDNVQRQEVGVKSIEEHKKRISEIKRKVHEQIGNPATLIDTYNDAGRQYMMALLAALKAVGPGSGSSPDLAMEKLEEVFQVLMQPPAEPKVEKEAESAPEPEERVEETPVPQVKEPVIVPESVKTSEPVQPPVVEEKEGRKIIPPLEPVVTLELAETPEPKPAPVQKFEIKKEGRPEARKTIPEPDLPKKPVPESTQDSAPEKEQELKEVPQKKEPPQRSDANGNEKPKLPKIKPMVPSVENEDNEEEIEAKPKSKLSPISTLASLLVSGEEDGKDEEKKPERAIHEIVPERMAASSIRDDIKKAKAEALPVASPSDTGYKPLDAVDTSPVPIKQSELSLPKVNQALDQLLDEWSLFKSGGLLGLGPSGSEHPLFQKLSNLSMGEVLAGRWEGSNREVTRTIKEYVDAWRHEQGVAYNFQETFEHYLRRVVLRILKRQEKAEG